MKKVKQIVTFLENTIDALTASSLLIHAIMVGAAIASYGNIYNYLSFAHTNETTAKALALVLGAALVVASSRLTKLNLSRFKSDSNMRVVVWLAAITGIASGVLQTAEYVRYYHWITASVLGFGIPVLLEVAPALTVALLKNIDEGERTEVLRRSMATKITGAIEIALDEIKPDDIRGEVERSARIFTREFVDVVTGDMFYQLRETSKHRLSEFAPQLQQPIKTQAKAIAPDTSVQSPVSEPMQVDASTETQALDNKAQAILDAIRNGATTPYAISQATGIAQTTLKRKQEDGTYIGRLPAMVAAGVLQNGGTDYRIA